MNIKTKSIITLCLTALASMPLSAQCYMGSVVDINGTWTTAKDIKVEESQIVFTDHNGAKHTISNSHGNSAPVNVIHDVLYADGNNIETLTNDMVEQVKRSGKLVVFGYLNDKLWVEIAQGNNIDGVTSALFYNLSGNYGNKSSFIKLRNSSISSVKFVNCKIEGVEVLLDFLANSGITEFSFEGLTLPALTELKSSFLNCSKLKRVSFVGLETSKVTTLFDLFANCSSLTEVDFSGCNLENVEKYGYAFYECKKLSTVKAIGCSDKTVEILRNALKEAGISENIIVTSESSSTTAE